MLELLGTVFGAIFSGGATGLLGVVAQRFADYKNKQLDMELEKQRQANAVELRRVDAEIMAQEYAAKAQIVTIQTEGITEVANAEAFAKSYDMEPKMYTTGNLTPNQRWVMVFLDALRGSVRPVLTIYLCVLITLVYMQARTLLGSTIDVLNAMELVKLVVGTILYLGTTCVLWWFGSRNSNKPTSKGYNV